MLRCVFESCGVKYEMLVVCCSMFCSFLKILTTGIIFIVVFKVLCKLLLCACSVCYVFWLHWFCMPEWNSGEVMSIATSTNWVFSLSLSVCQQVYPGNLWTNFLRNFGRGRTWIRIWNFYHFQWLQDISLCASCCAIYTLWILLTVITDEIN